MIPSTFHYCSLCCPSCPNVPFGSYPRCTVPPTCSLLSMHLVPLYHLGVISGVLFPLHVPCYPPCPIVPFGSYLRCTVPPTCSLLSTLSHCTIWELSQVYCSPYMFPAIHLVPLYHLGVYCSPYMFPAIHPVPLHHLGVISGVLFPLHVSCYPPCPIVPFGSYPRCTVPPTCFLLSTLSHCTI